MAGADLRRINPALIERFVMNIKSFVVIAALVFTFLSAQVSERAQTTDIDPTRWEIKDPKARVEEYLGRKSLYLTSGYAFLKDVTFANGVIEVDVAAPATPSFVGVVFRAASAGDHEIVYFRPHKSGLEDAVQYTPSFNGSACWQLYSGPGFTAATEIPQSRWVHVRIEIAGMGARVFFNNSEKPVLVVEDLKRGNGAGSIGIWGSATGGHFSNFTYRADHSLTSVANKPAPIQNGILTKWELSEAFDASVRNPETIPSPAELAAMKWQAVGVESPGMVVVNRYRQTTGVVPFFRAASDRIGKRDGRKAVFARTVINSDRDQIVKMSFGYSDEITMFLNARPVFTGRSAFRFRDPGFLGIMDVENDALYLQLKKGRNELLLGVADYFGGWGFICRLDGVTGVTTE